MSNQIRAGYFRAYVIDDQLVIDRQSGGFFADCSVRLHNIVSFFNMNKRLPGHVDSSQLFNRYKYDGDSDITQQFFACNDIEFDWESKVQYVHSSQYSLYENLPTQSIAPFIKKYFKPVDQIQQIAQHIQDQYNVQQQTAHYKNACAVLHRGTDKAKETEIPSIESIHDQMRKVRDLNKDVIFIIQSDCAEFLNITKKTFPDHHICFDEHIRSVGNSETDQVWKSVDLQPDAGKDMPRLQENNIFIKKYLAITTILAKCNYLICETGNCAAWLLFYRNNINNVMQFQGRWKREPVGWYSNI